MTSNTNAIQKQETKDYSFLFATAVIAAIAIIIYIVLPQLGVDVKIN